MKLNVYVVLVLFVALLGVSSCKEDKTVPSALRIELLEYGMGADKSVVAGDKLHVKAKVLADRKIENIKVSIKAIGGAKDLVMVDYPEFKGKVNFTFDKDVVIPQEATEGGYSLSLEATDQNGKKVVAKENIKILKKVLVKPTVEIVMLGEKNEKTVYVGRSLLVKANVKAEGLIEKIKVTLQGVTTADGKPVALDYKKFKGKKEVVFEEYIPIAESVKVGEYVCSLEVIDEKGQKGSVEDKFKVLKLADKEKPEIDVSKHPEPNALVEKGDRIIVGGTVTDNESLESLLVALVRFDSEIKDEAVTPANSIVLLNTTAFDRPTSHLFETYILIGDATDKNTTPRTLTDKDWALGEYYILVKCQDKAGNVEYSRHYPIHINTKS